MSDAPGTGGRLPEKEMAELVRRLDREIQTVLAKHGCGPDQGEQLVFETMLALSCRWSELEDRGTWFLKRLEEACQRASDASSGEAS